MNRRLVLYRLGLPTLGLLAVVPACFQQAGGVHGDLYGLFAFFFTLPAQYALGFLRDAGFVQGQHQECATVLTIHFITLFLLTQAGIAIFRAGKRRAS